MKENEKEAENFIMTYQNKKSLFEKAKLAFLCAYISDLRIKLNVGELVWEVNYKYFDKKVNPFVTITNIHEAGSTTFAVDEVMTLRIINKSIEEKYPQFIF